MEEEGLGDPPPTDCVVTNWGILSALDSLPTCDLSRFSRIDVGEESVDSGEEEANEEEAIGPSRSDSSLESTRLCGFLRKYKLGARSLTKTFKKRWFVFADSTCNLLYYRNPKDLIPLGEINISHATFTFDTASERTANNIFEVRVNNTTYWLEADDRNTMIFWLQELQTRRKVFRCRLANKTTGDGVNARHGLINFGDTPNCGSSPSELEPPILDSISMPEKTVGPTSAVSNSNRSAIKDISITHLKVEFRNMVSSMKPGRKTSNNHHGLHSPHDESRDLMTACSSPKPPSPMTTGKNRFPQFQDKFQLLKKYVGSKLITEPDKSPNCAKCEQLQTSLKSCQETALLVLEELDGVREMLKTAQREIGKLEAEGNIYREMMGRYSDDDYLKALSEKAAAEVELQSLIHDLSERFVRSEIQNRSLEIELQNLREDQVLYQDNIGVKDQIVVEQLSRITELEEALGKQCSYQDVTTNTDLCLINSTFDAIQEKCEAFELQNKFLNQEILELNQLLQQEEQRGDEYQVQLTQAEAQFYEMKSKYMYILHEISKSQTGVRISNSHQMVSQLLQDIIESDKSQNTKTSDDDLELSRKQQFPVDPYDQYGFSLQFTIEGEDLDSVAGNFLQRSQVLKTRRMNSDMLLVMKWEKFLISLGQRTPHRSRELKLMLREGISPQFRGKVWKICIDLAVSDMRSVCGSEYYKNLVERANRSTTICPIRHQVELDLLRTLPNNRYYECYESSGIPRLKNILLAFSVHNPTVGYCQGLNRLAAVLLLFLDEEESFWGLVAIIERLMPDRYYDHTLIAAHADQRVLKEIIAEKLPNLSDHFVELAFDVSLFTFNWFLAIFIDNIPVETYLRIWDSFLYEGSKILFRYTVAILKFCEEMILSKTDSADLHASMRLLGDSLTDVNRISQMAFSGLNPFPMRMITVKRHCHLQKLKVELEELEKLREQFQSSYSSQLCPNDDVISDITSDDESGQ